MTTTVILVASYQCLSLYVPYVPLFVSVRLIQFICPSIAGCSLPHSDSVASGFMYLSVCLSVCLSIYPSEHMKRWLALTLLLRRSVVGLWWSDLTSESDLAKSSRPTGRISAH